MVWSCWRSSLLSVGQITLGMHVLRADSRYGVVTGWRSVPGASVMYNLEVAQDHTFTVGQGQWVVHNSGNCGGGLPASNDEIRDGADQIQDLNGKFGNKSPDINWTFKSVSKPSPIANPRYPGDPFTQRYYFKFEDEWGDPVYVSANFDPIPRQWDTTSFHYSSGP
jgi:hypothetical protein